MKHLPFLLLNYWKENPILADTTAEKPKIDIFEESHKIDNISI
jgi:hypothetical protein